MSNNKQSSVEWLFEELFNSFEKFNNGEFSFAEYMAHNLKLRKQAKAMHKTEHFNTWWHGISENEPITFEQYYNETFGGKNE